MRGRDIYGDPGRTPNPKQAKTNQANIAKRLGAKPKKGKK